MEKPAHRATVLYGYTVCLISLIIFLASLSALVSSLFSLQDPLRASSFSFSGAPTYTLSSYEGYKADVLNGRGNGSSLDPKVSGTLAYVPTDSELRTAYQAAKDDRTASVRLNADQSIVEGLIFMVLSLGLFFWHWRWVNRVVKREEQ